MNLKTLSTRLLLTSLAYNRCQYHLNDLRMMFDILDGQTSADDHLIRHLVGVTKSIAEDLERGHKGLNVLDPVIEAPCNDNAASRYTRP